MVRGRGCMENHAGLFLVVVCATVYTNLRIYAEMFFFGWKAQNLDTTM